jgi:hypothetical protein
MNRVVHHLARAVVLASCSAIASCGHDTVAPSSPLAVPSAATGAARADKGRDSGPRFLRPGDSAPAIANPSITFVATKGQDVIVRMYYRPTRAGHDSSVFAEFRVAQQALDRRPDGSAIANGESVVITMTLVDAARGIIDFEPSGLRFSSRKPAVLRISYANANRDLNGDGVVDARDLLLEQTLHIACQETPSSPWIPVPSSKTVEGDEIEASISGFSGYAIDF